jgi:hypothetical protein
MSANLPECAECGTVYRRGARPLPGDRCYKCEAPLRLRVYVLRICPGGGRCLNHRQPCLPGHGILFGDYDWVT